MNEVEQAKDAIKKAQTVVSELCNGTRRWVMRVPAQLDDDPDIVIATALNLAKAVIEKSEDASLLPLSGEAATTDAASYIEAAEDLRAWLHEHIDDVPDEIYIPFIASIERAATLRQQFMRSLPPIWDDDAKRAIDSFVNDGIRKIEDEKVAEITREIRSVKRKLNSRTVTKRGTT